MPFKSGFVAIVGRPNAGKSTLVNTLVGRKVAIVSPKPQTTRNRIQGIVNRDDAQIVLIDTPGIHKAENALSRQMMDEVTNAFDGIDVLSLIVDAAAELRRGRSNILRISGASKAPSFWLLNKIDRVKKPRSASAHRPLRSEFEFAEIFPISALNGEGTPELVNAWLARFPEAPPYFPADQLPISPSAFSPRKLFARRLFSSHARKCPSHRRPASILSRKEKLIRIRATVYVEREGQKGILIGKRGETMKKIGTAPARNSKSILGIKFSSRLFVNVQPRWRENPASSTSSIGTASSNRSASASKPKSKNS